MFVTVKILLYSPKRPIVDISEIFLWLMAIGTVLGASFWSAWTAKEAAQEYYRSIKVRLVHKFLRIIINFTDIIYTFEVTCRQRWLRNVEVQNFMLDMWIAEVHSL